MVVDEGLLFRVIPARGLSNFCLGAFDKTFIPACYMPERSRKSLRQTCLPRFQFGDPACFLSLEKPGPFEALACDKLCAP